MDSEYISWLTAPWKSKLANGRYCVTGGLYYRVLCQSFASWELHIFANNKTKASFLKCTHYRPLRNFWNPLFMSQQKVEWILSKYTNLSMMHWVFLKIINFLYNVYETNQIYFLLRCPILNYIIFFTFILYMFVSPLPVETLKILNLNTQNLNILPTPCDWHHRVSWSFYPVLISCYVVFMLHNTLGWCYGKPRSSLWLNWKVYIKLVRHFWIWF